jgi:hypothetical protein
VFNHRGQYLKNREDLTFSTGRSEFYPPLKKSM